MTFLNPFVLFGLFAAAVPLLLHLLNLRKLRTIEFSTLIFLKQLQKHTLRKIKLRQWLLLLLRTLLIAAVVLSFSRPALRGSFGTVGTHAKTTVIVILDNSPSMALVGVKGEFLKQAKEAAVDIIRKMKDGDDAVILRLSDGLTGQTLRPSHDLRSIESAILKTEISPAAGTVEHYLRAAAAAAGESKNINKEIYIVTDGQRSSLSENPDSIAHAGSEKLFSSQTRLYFLRLTDRRFDNIGIDKSEILPAIFRRGKPFTVRSVITNYGKDNAPSIAVSLFLDGERISQKNIAVPPGRSATVELQATPRRAGILTGFVEIENDILETDNRSYFSLTIPEKISALLVTSDPLSVQFIATALSIARTDSQSTLIDYRIIPPQQFTASLLRSADVVAFSEVRTFNEEIAPSLKEAMAAGSAGIIIFPGSAAAQKILNEKILPLAGIPPMMRYDSLGSGFARFAEVDDQHPVFRDMFERIPVRRAGSLESPGISILIAPEFSPDVRTIIAASNKKSFLWERTGMQGKAVGFSVSPVLSWSDFPLKGIFVPLMYQVFHYAAANNRSLNSLTAGQSIDIPLAEIAAKGKRLSPSAVRILHEHGKEEFVQPVSLSGQTARKILPLGMLPEQGISSIVQDADTLARFAVNHQPRESNGEPAEEEDFSIVSEKLGASGCTVAAGSDELQKAVIQSRFGIELWKYFLILAVILSLIELAVARESKESAQE